MDFAIEVSARHMHVSAADFARLFGPDRSLTQGKALSQPGQWQAQERVSLVGPRGTIQNVSILGPFRAQSQVEVSLTDCRTLGVAAPVRESGNLSGSAPVTVIGPHGRVQLSEGLIVAQRHIHMTPADAAALGVADGQVVRVDIADGARPLTFGGTVVRVSDAYALAMHVDTDEANAAGGGRGVIAG